MLGAHAGLCWMPLGRAHRGNRLYADESTAQLEHGLQFDSNALSMKSLSDAAAPAASATAPAERPPGVPAAVAQQEGVATLLRSCSKISSLLLNLSEELKFAVAPPRAAKDTGERGRGWGREGEPTPVDTELTGAGVADGRPAWMRPQRYVRGLGGEARLPAAWKDAATRVAEHVDQISRLLSPTPIPFGLALLFSRCARPRSFAQLRLVLAW